MIFNKEVLIGNKTLSDSSKATQYLDPNGVNRDVNLPIPALSNPPFYIYNIGVQGFLRIQASNGQLHTITPGEAVRIHSDGTGYSFTDLGFVTSRDVTVQTYAYGGRVNSSVDFWWALGQTQDTPGTSTTDPQNFHTVTRDGTLAFLSWRTLNNMVGINAEVRINGVAVSTLITGIAGFHNSVRIPGNIPVFAGDTLSIRCRTNGAGGEFPNDSTIQVGIISKGGITYSWGGDPAAVGQYFRCLERASITSLSGAPFLNEEHTMCFVGTDGVLSYHTQTADGTTQFSIHKNGSGTPSEQFLATGNTGTHVMSTTVAQGDRLSVRWTAGTDPGDSMINIDYADVPGQTYFCGGGVNAADVFYHVNHPATVVFSDTSPSERHEMTLMNGGTVTIAWRTEGTATSGQWDVWKNGNVVESFGDVSMAQGVSTLATKFNKHDRIAITVNSGAVGTFPAQFNAHFNIAVTQ